MGYTKRQFIYEAMDEMGISPYIYLPSEEQMQTALFKLDNMMAAWDARGIRLSYPIYRNPEDSDLDERTLVPDAANEAICKNLAISLAPSYGRPVLDDTKRYAKKALDAVLARDSTGLPRQFPAGMPRGAGAQGWRYGSEYFPDPGSPLLAGDDSDIDLGED